MADHVTRVLRDGSLEGEHAVALTIKDSIHCPFGSHVFSYFLLGLANNISSGRSQARGLVLVALDRSPSFYCGLLKSRGLGVSSSDKWIHIVDCYSDPLGWKERFRLCDGGVDDTSSKDKNVSIFTNIKDVCSLLSLILDLGRGASGGGKARFAVAIDSISALLRHASPSSIANFINDIRSNDKISCGLWLIHSDLHDSRQSSTLAYMSTIVASLEPKIRPPDGEIFSLNNLLFLEQNSLGGKLSLRLKRRNGRVKILLEEIQMGSGAIQFAAATCVENTSAMQDLLPKVQFNLQLSEKERADRAKVVLPFEHQGNGETIRLYDGRHSHLEGKMGSHLPGPVSAADALQSQNSGKGEILYVRDSDDEMPDSDEDPDDDLDI